MDDTPIQPGSHRLSEADKAKRACWESAASYWMESSGYTQKPSKKDLAKLANVCRKMYLRHGDDSQIEQVHNLNSRLRRAVREFQSVVPSLKKISKSIADPCVMPPNLDELLKMTLEMRDKRLFDLPRRKAISARWHDPALQIGLVLKEMTGEAGYWRKHPRVRFISAALPAIGFRGVSPDAIAQHLQRADPS